jgi:hypothetical protein
MRESFQSTQPNSCHNSHLLGPLDILQCHKLYFEFPAIANQIHVVGVVGVVGVVLVVLVVFCPLVPIHSCYILC